MNDVEKAQEEERKRRLRAKVFGDVLPDTTQDEAGDPARDEDTSSDEWLKRQVPPHHG